jgi:hypothetical protein
LRKKIIRILEERIEHLNKWLKRVNNAKENIPNVQNMIDQAKLDLEAFSKMPDDGEEFIPGFVLKDYTKGNYLIKENLPLPPDYDSLSLVTTGVISTTGSTGAYTTIIYAGLVDDPFLNQWAKEYSHPYYELQVKQSRKDIVREKLQLLNPKQVIELDESADAYLISKNDANERTKAATCMRNLLEHFKGDLFSCARNWPKENMTWEKMSSRLSIESTSKVEFETFNNQEREWGELHSQLSAVLKKQASSELINLESLWVKLIDHLYVVLGLIDFSKISPMH